MNMKNSNISCDVCQDLFPLVKDNVASDDSHNIVLLHIENCENCRTLFEGIEETEVHSIDDHKNIVAIKKNVYFCGLIILAIGAMLGVYLSNSMGMFYNFIIMPIVGAFGYLMLRNKWYLAPFGVLILSYTWLFIGFIIEYKDISLELYTYPMLLAPIYTFLTALGCLIGALLKYALKKENLKL